jgi:putative redox protein
MPSLKVAFPGSAGAALAARLDLPDSAPRAYALFAHCFTCSKDSRAATWIARALAGQGIAVLRFDFTGLGGSEGEFENTDFSSNVADLVAAADWLRALHQAPAILIGHSLGGSAVLAAAGDIAEVRSVVTLNAPFAPDHVTRQFADRIGLIERQGAAEVTLAGRRFRLRREFLADLAGQKQAGRIAQLRRALLVMHAPGDAIVGIDNASAIFTAAKHPKSFVSLDDADHLLTREPDARYAAQVLAAWVGRYLPERSAQSVPPGVVRVTERRLGKFTTMIQTAEHTIYADEPVSAGGNATGLTPYELLQAALGACTVMTLRLYAEHKQLPLERARVDIEHDKIHAADCADCETREGRIDFIRRRLTLEGELTDAQRAKMVEIADKCPVHRTLHGEVRVVTELDQPSATS